MRKRIIRWLPLLLFLPALPCAAQTSTLNVGSKRFAESRILGEVLTQTANAVGEAHATHQSGLGNTGIVFVALQEWQHRCLSRSTQGRSRRNS